MLNQSSQTLRTPVRSHQRRCSPANQSLGPPSVLRTANSPAFLLTARSVGMEPQPPETAPTRSVVKVTSKQPELGLDGATEGGLIFTCVIKGGKRLLMNEQMNESAALFDNQVVKEIAAASRDVSAEDSLYETVKELKDPPARFSLPNGTTQLSPDVPPALLNGHLSPCTPERAPLCTGAEYASIDLKKKSRHSADMESKRRSNQASVPARAPLEEPEEDVPPPVPEKVLDENDNQPVLMNGSAGAGLHNGEVRERKLASVG